MEPERRPTASSCQSSKILLEVLSLLQEKNKSETFIYRLYHYLLSSQPTIRLSRLDAFKPFKPGLQSVRCHDQSGTGAGIVILTLLAALSCIRLCHPRRQGESAFFWLLLHSQGREERVELICELQDCNMSDTLFDTSTS